MLHEKKRKHHAIIILNSNKKYRNCKPHFIFHNNNQPEIRNENSRDKQITDNICSYFNCCDIDHHEF